MIKDKNSSFPEGFLWGASTSSYQVEGGNHNQWSLWEEQHATGLAASALARQHWLPVWEEIKDQAQDPNNYISGNAVEHYQRYEEDFNIAKKLNLNTLRFGIEWSRIEPEQGQWNEAAIEHYKQYIAALKKRGIQPVINLWHWTLPVWFNKKGGFMHRSNVKHFVRFVERIAKEIIVPCGYVITVNEPNSYTGMGYLQGVWPPQKHDPIAGLQVVYNLALAHRRIYKLLKKLEPTLQIGVATQCNNNRPERAHNPLDKLMAGLANYFWNWWFLNRVMRYQDFVGFNYYFTDYFKGVVRKNPKTHHHHVHTGHRGPIRKSRENPPGPLSDLGWYMEPSGIYHVIVEAAKRYKKPIIITETGVADIHDRYRKWWIKESLEAIERANQEGANVIGYFHWSLLDNFEWSTGWWPKFGLVAVDREHGMKRTIKPSGKWYAQQIKKLS